MKLLIYNVTIQKILQSSKEHTVKTSCTDHNRITPKYKNNVLDWVAHIFNISNWNTKAENVSLRSVSIICLNIILILKKS